MEADNMYAIAGTASEPAPPAEGKSVNARIGPAALHLLRLHDLDASQITPTGPNGIVTKGDVLAAVSSGLKGMADAGPSKV